MVTATRYTIQYWFADESDVLQEDFDGLQNARNFIAGLDKKKYKDFAIVARHWAFVNHPFKNSMGYLFDGWHWELIDDDYCEEIAVKE